MHYFFKRASLFSVFLFVDISFLSGYTRGDVLLLLLQESVATQFYSLNFIARFVISKCLKVKIGGYVQRIIGGGRKFGCCCQCVF